jgi:hypothetical protein
LFGQAPEPYSSLAKIINDLQQVLQRTTKPVELPNHQTVALADKLECSGESRSIISGTAGLILKQVPFIYPGSEHCILLQCRRLPVTI